MVLKSFFWLDGTVWGWPGFVDPAGPSRSCSANMLFVLFLLLKYLPQLQHQPVNRVASGNCVLHPAPFLSVWGSCLKKPPSQRKQSFRKKYISSHVHWKQRPIGITWGELYSRLSQVWSPLCLICTPLPYLRPIHPFFSSTLRCNWGLPGPHAEAQSCRLPPQW